MRCGEQCFIVTILDDQTEQHIQINARTAIKARKKIREMFCDNIVIKAVKLEKE